MLFYIGIRIFLIIEIFESLDIERLYKIVRNELSNFGWTEQKFYKQIIGHLRENGTQKFVNDLLAVESPIHQLINLSIGAKTSSTSKSTANSFDDEQQKSIKAIANCMKSVTNWAKFEQIFLFGQEMGPGGSANQFLVPTIDWQLAQRIRAHFGTEIGTLRNLEHAQAIDVGFVGIRQKLPKLLDICQQIDKTLQLMVFIRLSTKTTCKDKSGIMGMQRHGTQKLTENLLDTQLVQLRTLYNTVEQQFDIEQNAIWRQQNCGQKRVPIVCKVLAELRKLGNQWHEMSLQMYITSVCAKKLELGSTSQRRHGNGTVPYRYAMF